MNYSDDNQGRRKPVWFANEEELRRGYRDAFICALFALFCIGILWGVL